MMSGRKRSQAVRGTVLTANLPPAIKARQEAANRVDPNKIQPKPTLKETISQEISKRTLPIPDALSPAIIFHFETLLEGLAEMKLKGEQLVNFRSTEEGETIITTSFQVYLYFDLMEKNHRHLSCDEFHLKAGLDAILNLLYSNDVGPPADGASKNKWEGF